MVQTPGGEVTILLRKLKSGDRDILERLLELIYPELRNLARRQLQRERPGHVLQATALVNEAYIRMVSHEEHNWQNRAHFFGAASHLMRRILVDQARAEKAQKRDPGERVTAGLDDATAPTHGELVALLALDEALDALEKISPRQAQVVQLRYFGGLSVPEVAEALGMTARTIDRDWAAARAWLRLRLQS